MPFGKRARIYPGPAPLAEIVLEELSRHNKQPAAGPVVRSEKALEREEAEIGEPAGNAETERTMVADKKLLVAGRSPRKSLVSGANGWQCPAQRRCGMSCGRVGKYLQVGVKFVQLDYQP
jgi:hypothetical protein